MKYEITYQTYEMFSRRLLPQIKHYTCKDGVDLKRCIDLGRKDEVKLLSIKGFDIIKNSESQTGYDIPDKEWEGKKAGLVNGWQFEYKDKDGKLEYGSVSYDYGTPEEYANRWHTDDGMEWIFEIPMMNGYTPTGRVIFRGYATEYYDPEERDWYVEKMDI